MVVCALFGLLAGSGAAQADTSAPATATGNVLAKVAIRGPFADLEAYCQSLRDEDVKAPRCHPTPVAGAVTAGSAFDQVVAIDVTSNLSGNEGAIGFHDARGWWIDDEANLFADPGRGRGLVAVLDARWERGQSGPRLRIRQARSYWNKHDEDAKEPGFGEYQCIGSVIICGQDASRNVGCSAPLPVAVTRDCGEHDKPNPAWKTWERWTFRLEPTAVDRATWRFVSRGTSKRLLGRGALSGLVDDVQRLMSLRETLVRLPF